MVEKKKIVDPNAQKPILFVVLGLILVTGIAFCAYNFGKKQTSFDWKTYSDPDVLKVSFEYPSSWRVSFEEHLQKTAPAFISPCDFINGGRCASLGVGEMGFLKNWPLRDYFSLNLTGSHPDKILKEQNISIGGEKALLIEYSYYGIDGSFYGDMSGGYRDIVKSQAIVIHKQRVYYFGYGEYERNIEKIKSSSDWLYKDVFNKTISTFKFLD